MGEVLPVYATWFPTLQMTLSLLSKIYRAVEIHVFQEMAQQVGRRGKRGEIVALLRGRAVN
jgi:hypothetical protein